MTDALPRDLLFLVHELAHSLRVRFDQHARRHGMTRAQWAILIHLDRNPGLTQKELAHLVEVEPMTVARLVDRLEAPGYVERRPDPGDRRVWRLHLTPAARPVLAEIEEVRATLRDILFDGFAPAAIATTEATLHEMKDRLASDPRIIEQPAAAGA